MSYNPQQPNWKPQEGGWQQQQGGWQQQGGGYPGPPPQKSNLTWLWILLGGGGGILVLSCVGCCVGAYFMGTSMDAEDVRIQFQDHPIVLEHIGEIQSISTNHGESLAHENDAIWIYDVSGTNGSGKFIVEEGGDWDTDELEIISAELELPDGQRFQLR